uniref:Uncharacterized protein n=1 Tax=Candidatus Kentrum sp. DK TaxID=2126562 RepID=A0A450S1Y7_9GAMM|nr:MAG: hypothetical protein BECKDK2373C_GA0170839_101217 [Candidatus Kentron sp. DK]
MMQVTLNLPDELARFLIAHPNPDAYMAQIVGMTLRHPEAGGLRNRTAKASGLQKEDKGARLSFSRWWRNQRTEIQPLPEPGADPRLDYLRERYRL